jgi:hypothetical protein
MSAVFFTARQLIGLYILPKWQKCNEEHFTQNRLPSLVNEKKRSSGQKIAINFSLLMDKSMDQKGHQVVDELRRLKIFRAPYPRSRQTSDRVTFGCSNISKED